MKKRNAIALSTLLLLSVGAAWFVIKNQKEKKEIEKDVKEVLIPNAERVLDSLQQKYESTLALYDQQSKLLVASEQKQDSLEKVVALEEQIKHVNSLVNDLKNQFYSKTNRIIEELGLTAFGEDGCMHGYEETDEYGLLRNPKKGEEHLYQEYYYLTGNQDRFLKVPVETGKTLLGDSLYIPTRNAQTYYRNISGGGYWGSEETAKGFYTREVDEFLYIMSEFVIPVVYENVHAYEYLHDGARMYPKDSSPEYAISVLNALQRFVDGIDNSGNAFNPKTLSDLRKTIKVLKAGLEELISMNSNVNKTRQQVASYKKATDNLRKNIQKSKDNLSMLKGPDVVKELRARRKAKSK